MTHQFALDCRAKGQLLTFRHSQCHSTNKAASPSGEKMIFMAPVTPVRNFRCYQPNKTA